MVNYTSQLVLASHAYLSQLDVTFLLDSAAGTGSCKSVRTACRLGIQACHALGKPYGAKLLGGKSYHQKLCLKTQIPSTICFDNDFPNMFKELTH
eukprot:5497403-Amphidinium_carterae.1